MRGQPAGACGVQQVRFLKDIYGSRFVLLRGNHEDYLLRDRLSLRERMVWNRVGRPAAVKSFRAHDAALEDSIPFLKENCRLFYKGEGFQCVHAGVRTDPVEENDTRTLIHDHDTVPQNRYAGPLTVTGHIALTEPRWYAGDERTVKKIPWGEWRDLPTCGIICIDTGCGKGGRLTGMVIRGRSGAIR